MQALDRQYGNLQVLVNYIRRKDQILPAVVGLDAGECDTLDIWVLEREFCVGGGYFIVMMGVSPASKLFADENKEIGVKSYVDSMLCDKLALVVKCTANIRINSYGVSCKNHFNDSEILWICPTADGIEFTL